MHRLLQARGICEIVLNFSGAGLSDSISVWLPHAVGEGEVGVYMTHVIYPIMSQIGCPP